MCSKQKKLSPVIFQLQEFYTISLYIVLCTRGIKVPKNLDKYYVKIILKELHVVRKIYNYAINHYKFNLIKSDKCLLLFVYSLIINIHYLLSFIASKPIKSFWNSSSWFTCEERLYFPVPIPKKSALSLTTNKHNVLIWKTLFFR